MTAPVIEVTPDVDMESVPVCEIQYADNDEQVDDNPAEWVVTYKCCGLRRLACNDCFQEFLQASYGLQCCRCGTWFVPFREGIMSSRRL